MRERTAPSQPAPVDGDLRLGSDWAALLGHGDPGVGAAATRGVAGTSIAPNMAGDFLKAALRACGLLAEREAGEAP
jgi:hypothetical protein